MNQNSDEVDSADQDAWVAIAEQLRAKLAETITLIPAMKPDEVVSTIRAVDDALRLHQRAMIFDATVQRELNRHTAPEYGV